jgi:hypothetical protein
VRSVFRMSSPGQRNSRRHASDQPHLAPTASRSKRSTDARAACAGREFGGFIRRSAFQYRVNTGEVMQFSLTRRNTLPSSPR